MSDDRGKKDALFVNKIVAGFLVGGLLSFGVAYFGDYLYDIGAESESVGYAIEGGAVVATGGVKVAESLPLISPLLAGADIERGRGVAKKCQACHTFHSGGADRVGPNLYDNVGSAVASRGSYNYSSALLAKGGIWDYETLNDFLYSPRKSVKGTKMGFAGLKKERDRADIILFLRSLSASPIALP